MRAKLCSLVPVVLTLLSACGSKPPPGEPGLVVVIAVDQLRYDFLTRFGEHYEGGFRRLLDSGAVFENASFRHAAITATHIAASVIIREASSE